MKAEELQYNDWVLNTLNNTYNQVSDIFPLEGKIYAGYELTTGMDWELDDDDFEFIPITPEILEKNGIERYGLSDLYECYCDDGSIFVDYKRKEVTIKGYCRKMWFDDIPNLHELQHAMRLCGIEKKIML